MKRYFTPKKKVTENIQSRRLIDEALGSFDGQYHLADLISQVAYDMFIDNVHNQTIENIDNESIKQVFIELDTNTLLPQIKGTIVSLNLEEKKIGLKLMISPKLKKVNSAIVKKRIKNVITHELMHGKIFLSRLENDVELEDAPDYYNAIIYLMGVSNEDSLLYKFCYALYATYYQEVNAIVSQTNIQMYNILGYGKEHSNDEIKLAIMKTEPYQIYSMILHDIIPTLENTDDERVKSEIVDKINELDVCKLNIGFVKESIKRIKLVAMKALRNIFKNAMLEGKAIYKELIF